MVAGPETLAVLLYECRYLPTPPESCDVEAALEALRQELEEQAIETAKEHPEWDWSKGWTPWPDGSIRPAAEVEQQMDEAFENAKEKMKR